VVVAVAIVERIGPVLEALAARGLAVDATTVQANRVLPIAGGHRLAATNPITIIRGGRP
jgi:precorrin-6Y C5,15-methyltransferase (decarboxylating)